MPGENDPTAVLDKVRRENSRLMKSNLGTLCNIRELDYNIMYLRQELRRLHQIMSRNGLSLIKAELLEEGVPKQLQSNKVSTDMSKGSLVPQNNHHHDVEESDSEDDSNDSNSKSSSSDETSSG